MPLTGTCMEESYRQWGGAGVELSVNSIPSQSNKYRLGARCLQSPPFSTVGTVRRNTDPRSMIMKESFLAPEMAANPVFRIPDELKLSRLPSYGPHHSFDSETVKQWTLHML